MVLMAQYKIFGILLKSILAMILKHDLNLMICSPIKQIYKNIGGQEQLFQRSKYSLLENKMLGCCDRNIAKRYKNFQT
jgi:hypothetical protein